MFRYSKKYPKQFRNRSRIIHTMCVRFSLSFLFSSSPFSWCCCCRSLSYMEEAPEDNSAYRQPTTNNRLGYAMNSFYILEKRFMDNTRCYAQTQSNKSARNEHKRMNSTVSIRPVWRRETRNNMKTLPFATTVIPFTKWYTLRFVIQVFFSHLKHHHLRSTCPVSHGMRFWRKLKQMDYWHLANLHFLSFFRTSNFLFNYNLQLTGSTLECSSCFLFFI